MAARNRLPPWHQELRLTNGREVLIRPIRPDDALPLRAGFDLLQPEEVRHRFLYALKELSTARMYQAQSAIRAQAWNGRSEVMARA